MSKATRYSWTLRQELVHAAGCVYGECPLRCGAQGLIEAGHCNGVRIPRSLRKYTPQVELDAEWVRMRDNRRAGRRAAIGCLVICDVVE